MTQQRTKKNGLTLILIVYLKSHQNSENLCPFCKQNSETINKNFPTLMHRKLNVSQNELIQNI